MMPTWNPAMYRPDAPSGSSGAVRMAAACSIGGNAVEAAPHSTIAPPPTTRATSPAPRSNANDVSTANAVASAARQPTTDACVGDEVPGDTDQGQHSQGEQSAVTAVPAAAHGLSPTTRHRHRWERGPC